MSTRSILPSSKVRAAVKTVAPWQGSVSVPSQGVIKLSPMEQNQTDMFNFASLVLKEICNPEIPPFPLPTGSISKNQSNLENHMLKRIPEWQGWGMGRGEQGCRPTWNTHTGLLCEERNRLLSFCSHRILVSLCYSCLVSYPNEYITPMN